MNGVIENVLGMDKNFKVCSYAFYLKKCARLPYYTLLTTPLVSP